MGINMDFVLLTQNSTPIFKYVVWLLGLIMNAIFELLNFIGIPNIGLSIILFTIVIYLLLMPLTIKQQKFSKLSAKMNPELTAIQDKYKGRQDNEAIVAMNAERKQIYAKYGVSPSGSCLQLLIQMPILFALYRVINSIPAYVHKLTEVYGILAGKIVNTSGGVDYVKETSTVANMFTKNFALDETKAVIDILNKTSTADLADLSNKIGIADLIHKSDALIKTLDTSVLSEQFGFVDTYREIFIRSFEKGSEIPIVEIINHCNNFLGLNIANSPMNTIKSAFAEGNYFLLAGAVAIPVLSAVTQWINYKLMPQATTADSNDNKKKQPQSDTAEAMQQSMKTMNTMMPLMSAWFCLTLPAGMGLYWVIGAVVRSIQQVVINKHIDKIDIDAQIAKNIEKYNEKLRKQGIDPAKLNATARTSTKNISSRTAYQNSASKKPAMTDEEKAEAVKKSTEYYNKNAKPGSLASKADMVRQYNEKNNK